MLDDKSPVPLYYQLQEIIRSRIESGQWQSGQQLPPEAELCEEFSLSRGTVRQALADLVREGMLHRRRGKGSFVATPKVSHDLLSSAYSLSAEARQLFGEDLGNRLISIKMVVASKSVTEKLRLSEGTEVAEIRKVKLASGQPYFLATSYISTALCPELDQEDHSSGSLIEMLQRKSGIQIARVQGWFEPVLVNEYEASWLGVERGSPAMLYESIRSTTDARPVMLTKHIIRGDMCRLTFQLNNHNGQ